MFVLYEVLWAHSRSCNQKERRVLSRLKNPDFPDFHRGEATLMALSVSVHLGAGEMVAGTSFTKHVQRPWLWKCPRRACAGENKYGISNCPDQINFSQICFTLVLSWEIGDHQLGVCLLVTKMKVGVQLRLRLVTLVFSKYWRGSEHDISHIQFLSGIS